MRSDLGLGILLGSGARRCLVVAPAVSSQPRIAQIDGLRGLAFLGVAWVHWAPPSWRGPFPWEIGVFLFFVLSGFLVTRNLLAARDRAPSPAGRLAAARAFLGRRQLRLLAPYYAALVAACLLGAGDIRQCPLWYVFHLVNIHIALDGTWPGGIAHFWTLSVQQQFYLAWPWLILFLPRRALGPVLVAATAMAPLWRMAGPFAARWFADPSMLPVGALDYLGCGSLLGLAMHCGREVTSRRMAVAAWLCFAAYGVLYACWRGGHGIPYLASLQQTFLAVAFTVLAAFAHRGIRGPVGHFLSHRFLLRVGTYSYGLYLFHNLAPLLAGKIAPFLWHPALHDPLATILRLPVWAALAWAMAGACHRWIETPLAQRSRPTPETNEPVGRGGPAAP